MRDRPEPPEGLGAAAGLGLATLIVLEVLFWVGLIAFLARWRRRGERELKRWWE